jgi:hypothetical protein
MARFYLASHQTSTPSRVSHEETPISYPRHQNDQTQGHQG